jgi:hypothetical protein
MSDETARPRPLLRLNQKAQLVPAAQVARWHEIASATAGLNELDHQVTRSGAGRPPQRGA